ncbi:STAS domain-containing protein [Streptomyces sp. NPDC004311]|uniref:STAS domain-containing protein n=1 Tax=Streptomyces sp. NPDC004311 TaxID=3364698 RepID=UPI0036B039DF
MLPIEMTDSGVLIIRVRADMDIADRSAAAGAIDALLGAHRSAPVVLELTHTPVSQAALSTVVRAHHMCRHAGVPLAVVTADAEECRALASTATPATPAFYDSRASALSELRVPAATAA